MAGGTWIKQDKVRPGAYINVKAKKNTDITVGDRGVATLPLILSYGPEQQVLEIRYDDELKNILGFDINDSAALLIRETFKKAETILLYRLNKGTASATTHGSLTITSKYSGVKGNDITIVIQNNIDVETAFDVITLFEGNTVEKQVVKTIEELKENFYVAFSGTGAPTITAGMPLTGGTDGVVTNKEYTDYLATIEAFDFDCMGIVSKDSTLKATAYNFITRLRDREGRKIQLVLENYPEADNEAVISVKNGVILKDGTVIDSEKAVAFMTGATAGAAVNKSNTYVEYEGAVDVDKKYNDTEIKAALKNGEIVFTIFKKKVIIEQDINTLKTFTDEKTKVFRKNRVIRTLDGLANDIFDLYMERYVMTGADNDDDGRTLFRKDVIALLKANQKIHALQNVLPEDVQVTQGEEIEGVVANVAVQPVDSMEKLYMTILVA